MAREDLRGLRGHQAVVVVATIHDAGTEMNATSTPLMSSKSGMARATFSLMMTTSQYGRIKTLLESRTSPVCHGRAMIVAVLETNQVRIAANADRYLPSDAEIQNINWQMDVYDAYYNGTVIMTLTPDPNNANTSACATITSQTIEDAYLRIGPRSRDGVDRGIYDSNDLYLAIGRSLAQYKCPYTPNALFFAVESSSSLTYHGTIWDLNATKTANGDGFDIQGSVNSRQAAYNNHYNYVMNTTDPGYGATSNNVTCPDWFIKQALTSLHSPTLSGSVTDESGQVTWSFNDIYFGYKVSATFEGKAWDKGAKLDTSGDVVATTGQAKRVKWRSDEPSTAEKYKWVIVGCVIGGIIIIGWCVWKCCGVCSSKKKPAKQPETYVLQGQTWQRH